MLRTIFVAVGWALLAFLVTRVSSVTLESKIYDPYEILDIKKVRGHVVKVYQVNRILTPPPARASRRRRSSRGTRNSP